MHEGNVKCKLDAQRHVTHPPLLSASDHLPSHSNFRAHNSNIGTQRYVPIYVGMAWQTLMATNLEPHVVEAMFPELQNQRFKTKNGPEVFSAYPIHRTPDSRHAKKGPEMFSPLDHFPDLQNRFFSPHHRAEGSTPVPGVSNNPQAVSFFSFRCVSGSPENQDFDAQPPYACLTALIQQARFDCHNGCIPRASAFWHARLGQSTQASRTVN
ncbi:hypothetical protein DFP72DRAFT_1094303 [Ephemerocybe angulata]|uniref:Uncharacterized protein n=1 Tax=Ephemerocybe angulata TaxID=980116 RepID=A0A8H6MA03_9AGAR|nr:hypothetical protein DFP72DRAFT_1094303 [Tulosesus angulatus]